MSAMLETANRALISGVGTKREKMKSMDGLQGVPSDVMMKIRI